MKIFAAGIATETNTFCPIPTSLEDFVVLRGRTPSDSERHDQAFDLGEVWGKRARARAHEFIFSLMAWAMPSGLTVRRAYESLRDEMLSDLRSAMPVDVVLLMLHGAMVADGYGDCEEDMIRRVRDIVGRKAVIGVELDLHCHLSQAKIDSADIVITYKEYPHVDVNQRAAELFDLAVAARGGEVHPTMALFDCRMVGLYPTTREPLKAFVAEMLQAEQRKGVLSVSFGHGFEHADVPHLGAKVIAVTDGDPELAKSLAREIGLRVHGLRRQIGFESMALPMDEALSKALESGKTPVVVADQSDNVGGGAPGDATFVLRWLLDRRVEKAAMAIFYDPGVVDIARKAGKGAKLPIRIGGKGGPSSGDPIDVEATVLETLDDYVHEFPQLTGDAVLYQAGNVAALRCEGIDVLVSSKRCQCVNPAIFRDLGVDPEGKRLIVVKSMQHFRGAFAPLAGEIIYMAAPGAVPPDPRMIPYQKLDTGRLYPWVENPLVSD